MGLYLVDLLCVQAELCLAQQDIAAAELAARTALKRATDPECQHAWATAEAGHLVGQALILQQQDAEARAVLEQTLALQTRLGDPRRDETACLLTRCK